MILPEHILKLMDPKDRPKGKEGWLAAEAGGVACCRLEREEQKDFRAWLMLRRGERQLTFDWSRTDKRTTRELGRLDFAILSARPYGLFIEFKSEGGKLSAEQEAEAELLVELGHLVYVAVNADQAIKITRGWLQM